ncbi:MAG TPA: c-type cytochrome [Candidatus Latescibacteria bacterium]|jgi:cytochrome c553|nr:cytochrome c oxidase subunit II [Gemmatimonadaceae bacterium]MDP6016973.1 c-type cytochrome [Candidatus Latescibacterota bacterium]HJP31638.1 c-type cytochrome [Candidatus Latescibacterota bacterium]
MVLRIPVIIGMSTLALLCSQVATASDMERGEELYELCAQCHGGAGEGDQTVAAPSIAGLDQWYLEAQLDKFRQGMRGMHPDDATGLRMRPMAVTLIHEGDVADVSAYVANMPPVLPPPVNSGGDVTRGKALYVVCATCHGPQATGDVKQKAPPLVRSSDWYLLTQLQKFKSGLRGTDPRDVSSLLMRPMAMALPDDQAMKDVIAYIMSLPR